MSERTLNLAWCSFTCYEDYEFPENIRLIESRPAFNDYKKQLFINGILSSNRRWRDFFETYLLPFGFDFIEHLIIIGDTTNANRKFDRFGFFENTVEITFQESENELLNFLEIIDRLNEIISKDIIEILALFDLEFNYSMIKLGDKTEYEADFAKRFESKETVFYNIFEPIRNYLTTHFKGFDIAKSDFICGELKIFRSKI